MEAVFAAQRLERVDGMRRELLTEAAGRGAGVTDIVERSIRLELAAAMRVTEYAAGRMIVLAEALVHRYPAALDSLGGGADHAQARRDPGRRRGRSCRRSCATRSLAARGGAGGGGAGRHVPACPAGAGREGAGRDPRGALAGRRAEPAGGRRTRPRRHGPAAAVRTAWWSCTPSSAVPPRSRRPSPAARATPEPSTRCGPTCLRPADRRRHRCRCPPRRAASGHPSSSPCRCCRCSTTTARTAADLPVVEGIGPIPVSVARELCGGDASWMRVLTHPETGMVLSVGRDQYRPPAPLRKLTKWRADRCMGPGCGMPASRCEIDHNIAWEHGGRHRSRTTRRSARATTSSNTTAAGMSARSQAAAAPSNGPHPPAAATSSNPNAGSPSSARARRAVPSPATVLSPEPGSPPGRAATDADARYARVTYGRSTDAAPTAPISSNSSAERRLDARTIRPASAVMM